MKIRLTAPEGYKYRDVQTDREYSEIVTTDKDKDRYVLVPDNSDNSPIDL